MEKDYHVKWVYEFMKGKPYTQESISECYEYAIKNYASSIAMKRRGIRDWWYSHHETTVEEAPQEVWAEVEYILMRRKTGGRKAINTYYVLNRDDYQNLINHKTASTKQRLFIELLATTGMRIGEAVSLRWDDAVFEKSDRVEFMRTAEKTKRQVHFDIDKDLLKRIKDEFGTKEYIISTSTDRSYERSYISNQINKVGKRAIGQSISAHSLRRYFVTTHYEAGTPYDQIAYLLGHKNKSTFLLWYNKPEGEKNEYISQRRAV